MEHFLFPLRERKLVAEGTMAFWFDTSGSDYTFAAGQHADYTFINPPQTDAEGNARTFSFAAAPGHRQAIMITTRLRPTAFKNVLRDLPLGTNVQVTGPSGDMTLHEDASQPAVFIAGGIGITPFRSIIEDATLRHLPHRITFLYSNRTPAITPFLTDLEMWERDNPHFTLIATITDASPEPWPYEHGRIDEAFVRKHVPDLTQPIFYLAGPPEMVTAMQQVLKNLAISKDRIKTESFSGY